MASELSDYLANQILNWLRGSAFAAAPADVYVALHTTDPGVNGVGSAEVTDDINGTGRVVVSLGAVASRETANDVEVDFGTSLSTVTIAAYTLWDASTLGNCLGRTLLTATRNIVVGDPVSFLIGDLRVGFPTA